MARLREIARRLRMLLSASRFERDLDEEIRLHLELRERKLGTEGLSPEQARIVARRRFGNVTRLREDSADAWGWRLITDLARDVRHGLRALRRAPIFASAAILTLGLGIAANTAIFSVVNGVLLRPLVYPRPAQLMYLTTQGIVGRPGTVSVAEYLEFQQFNRSFADVGAFRTGETNLMAGDRAVRVRSATVDAHLLGALGVQPAQGRLFTPNETGIPMPPLVALLSHGLWQSGFGGQPIIGRTIDVGGQRHEIVGVMSRGVDLMDTGTDIWLPLGFTDQQRFSRNNHGLSVIGRLRDGITPASAQIELDALMETWVARTGINPGAEGHAGHVFLPLSKGFDSHVLRMTPLAEQILGRAGSAIWMLQAAVGLVLLIAGVNVANLMLARTETRRREFALLTALGAGRGRLIRKAMTESMILSIAGGAVGVLIARAGVEALVRAYPGSLPRIGDVSVDLRVTVVAFAVALGCGLLFGLASVVHTRGDATGETLKSGQRVSTGTARHQMRRALVMAQIALAVIVVVGAGLLLRTVYNLTAVDTGFTRSRLVTFSITLPVSSADMLRANPNSGIPNRDRARRYQSVLNEVRAIPGVSAATAMTGLPLDRTVDRSQTEIANKAATTGPPYPPLPYQRVMSDYFETMGIAILRGRGFHAADAGSGRVAIVNASFVRAYWAGLDPIGQRLRPGGGDIITPGPGGDPFPNPWFTVIGVAKDVTQASVDEEVSPEVYVLVDQIAADGPAVWLAFSPMTMNVVARTSLPTATLVPMIARAVRNVDPTVPVARLRELEDVFNESIQRPRLLAQLLTLFSALALLLAAIGTYGLLAYMVAERRLETAIRIALGAARSTVFGQVLGSGLKLTIAGLVVGLVGAMALNRLIASLLFGVEPTDAPTLAIVTATITVVAVVPCVLPAWRASCVSANLVLRAD
jgi:putative ABC transport system permease protein